MVPHIIELGWPSLLSGKETNSAVRYVFLSSDDTLRMQVVRRLDAVVAAESSPGDDGELLFVTRLLQLGAAAKSQLRARRCPARCWLGSW